MGLLNTARLLLALCAAAAVAEDEDILTPLTEGAEELVAASVGVDGFESPGAVGQKGPDLGEEAKEELVKSARSLGMLPGQGKNPQVAVTSSGMTVSTKQFQEQKIPKKGQRPQASQNPNVIHTSAGTIHLGHDPNKALKARLIDEEFDPTSREGALHLVSSVDLHAMVAKAHRERQEGRSAGSYAEEEVEAEDKAAVLDMFGRAMTQTMADVDDYSGMRELRGAVLGSGTVDAINLTSFGKFENVVLADVQSSLSQRGVALQLADNWGLQEKFSYYREDVTGLIPAFHWRCENLFGVADDEDEAFRLLRNFFVGDKFIPEHLKYNTVGNSSMRYVPRSDVIVINMLLHEVGALFLQHLSSELDRLKGHTWPGAGSDVWRNLGEGASAVVQKVTTYLVKRILRLIRNRKGRTLIFVLSLGKTVETKLKKGADTPTTMVKRRGHSDGQWIDMLKEADFGNPRVVFEEAAERVAARWRRRDTQYTRTEEVHLTVIEYGKDMNQAEWLQALSSGNWNPFGNPEDYAG